MLLKDKGVVVAAKEEEEEEEEEEEKEEEENKEDEEGRNVLIYVEKQGKIGWYSCIVCDDFYRYSCHNTQQSSIQKHS